MSSLQQDILDFISENLNISHQELVTMQLFNPNEFQKMAEKMKRKMRREKAKQRKHKEEIIATQKSKKIKKCRDAEEIKENDRKTIQMIRNRISAQNSRDRKKQYLNHLEYKAQLEVLKNKALRQELEELKEQHIKITNKSSRLKEQLNIAASRGPASRLGKIGLALLTLVSVFSVIEQRDVVQHHLIPLIKVEEMSSESAGMLHNYEKYSVVDTNTFIEEKIEALEESENYYQQFVQNPMFLLQQQCDQEFYLPN